MYYSDMQIVLQEVPGEVSICFIISGCKIRCEGCHSPHIWKEGSGILLTDNVYKNILKRYKGFASCVLFMGGEWHPNELIQNLKIAREFGYNTCLYTGEDIISNEIKSELTWLKTGPWKEHLGGLNSKNSNQVFRNVKTNEQLNYLFK